MKRAMVELLSGRDNVTLDLLRVLALVAVIVGLVLQVMASIWPDRFKFDMLAYGGGLGAVFVAVGGAMRLQAPTEPPKV